MSTSTNSKKRRTRQNLFVFLLALSLLLVIVFSGESGALRLRSSSDNGGVKPSVSIVSLGVPITQNFDTLATSGTTNTWTDDSTLPGWYAQFTTTSNPTIYRADSGGSNTGAIYSWGNGTSTERALGSVSSGTPVTIYFALKLTNNTGATITSLDISYNGEQWRDGGAATPAAQTTSFQYQVANTGTITDANTPTTGWTGFSSLNFTSPTFTNTGAGAALDGNSAANRTAKSASLPVTVNNGQEVWLRWVDINDAGNDHGLAIDDFSVTPQGAGATPTLNINDVTQAETDAGTTSFIFNVSLTQPAGVGGVTFQVDTADGTTNPANAGSDYTAIVASPGSITQGNSSTTVTVTVNGDTTPEADETFFVNISNVTGATAGDTQGLGTITNDDVSITKIHDIQGSGNTSPLSGSVTTNGIVTGVRSNGFFIQEPDATVDADPNTSEGIFVFTSSAPPAAAVVGNSVQVTGTISEFIPSADPFSPSQTELTSPTTSLLSSGNPLPAPHTITAAETTSPNDYNNLERFEGMRVTVPSMTAISGTQGSVSEANATSTSSGVFYGTVTGVARPFREPGIELPDTVPTPWPSGAVPANVPRFDFNPERLRVNSKALTGSTTLDVTSGQVITDVTGPLDYGFRTYTIDTDPTTVTPAPVISGPNVAVNVPAPTANELTISSFNMERFFDTVDDAGISDVALTSTAFNGRLNKASLAIRNVLQTPDVIGVEEMENLSTLQAVATKVNADAVAAAQPDPMYQAFLSEGNDPGGIDVGFLVKTAKVTVFSVTQYNKTETYTDPGTGPGTLLNDRPPLVLRASVANPAPFGGTFFFTVIANHMRSLNGVDDLTTAHTRVKKQKQAESLATLINAFETSGDPQRVAPYDDNILTLGDLNAFQFNDGYCDVVGTLLGTPPPADQVVQPTATIATDMKDLITTVSPATQQYSYSFDGDAQAIDHELVNHSMFARFSRMAYGRMDADYPELFRSDFTRPERISDHDPSVAYFDLSLVSPAAADASVAGHITDSDGVPLSGVGIRLSGTQNRLTITDASGNYHFDSVETNGFYTVTPTRVNYSFSPATHSFSALGHHIDAAFNGSYTGERANPLDTTEYFVRQHYLDFLGREPEEAGLNGWVNTINNCRSGDASCDRVHVSEAFFRSQEFQERGYFLYRFYSVAFGRKPDYAEFAPDLTRVSGFLDNSQLDAAKTAFANSFAARPAFMARYDVLNNGEYVDALMNTAGVNLADRQSLIDALNSGAQTRAQVLRQIAERGDVYQKYYNQAFVVMEYFGYLQRDPDALYLNWIVVLDANPADSRRMVEGFVNAAEYRARFAR